jgi:NADH dehydrogenase (ubiquinone) Fe-S protein 1
MGRTAVVPPGAAREDWKILRALSEVVGTPLPYDDVLHLRDRMWDISPTLVRYDSVETPSIEVQKLGLKQLADVKATGSGEALKKPIDNFYQTNPVARASVTMAACVKAFVTGEYKIQDEDAGDKQVSSRLTDRIEYYVK